MAACRESRRLPVYLDPLGRAEGDIKQKRGMTISAVKSAWIQNTRSANLFISHLMRVAMQQEVDLEIEEFCHRTFEVSMGDSDACSSLAQWRLHLDHRRGMSNIDPQKLCITTQAPLVVAVSKHDGRGEPSEKIKHRLAADISKVNDPCCTALEQQGNSLARPFRATVGI